MRCLATVAVVMATAASAWAQPAVPPAARPATGPSTRTVEQVALFRANIEDFGGYLSFFGQRKPGQAIDLILLTAAMARKLEVQPNAAELVRVISKDEALAIVERLAEGGLFDRIELPPPGPSLPGWSLEINAGKGPAAFSYWYLGRDDATMVAHPAMTALLKALDGPNGQTLRQFIGIAPAATSATRPAEPAARAADFTEVRIESRPKGWGSAHKTVKADGGITGGHLSGSPDAVMVHEGKSQVSPEDLAALRQHVAALRAAPPAKAAPPDQKTEGYCGVAVTLGDGTVIGVYAKWGAKFESADAQAIWDLLAGYHAGAW